MTHHNTEKIMELVLDNSIWKNFLDAHGYCLLGHLDSGSFSDVYAVQHKMSGVTLAVKRMVARRDMHADPRVMAEVRCLKELRKRSDCCVIGLEEAVVLERVACLFLELAACGNLEHYVLQHWPLPERQVACIVRQVLTALAHCHRLGIAHRDLNPANVLLVTPEIVRLADFGLAVSCQDPATGKPLTCDDYLGRESYLAPEVLRHSPYLPREADLWSIGCLSYFLLTAQHPRPWRTFCSAQAKPEVCDPGHPSEGLRCPDVVLDSMSQLVDIRDSLHDRSDVDLTFVAPCPRTCPLLLRHMFPTNRVDRTFAAIALVGLLGEMCVIDPFQRLGADDALLYWETLQKSRTLSDYSKEDIHCEIVSAEFTKT